MTCDNKHHFSCINNGTCLLRLKTLSFHKEKFYLGNMGNNNKKKTLIKKQSSYISTQEFVDKFTAAFTDILRYTLIAVEHHSKEEYTAKVIIKPLVPGGDLVKPTSLADTYSVGPLTSEVFYGIISEAHLKARQQLDSLSSRY
ncbi:hypothetical protein GLOIN_2v1784074 [Rhizophagus irregularis DAOM 181602=DAOM 197198]|nr:hypothetical protein GLOIN_2v1784074 [Rhizophagus irregularis DAOM 181602=DAOM 197198]